MPAACEAEAALLFAATAPDGLEPLFRRGPEWEAGVEAVLVLAQVPGAADADADAYVAQLAALAESSLAGALQATHGRLVNPSGARTFGAEGEAADLEAERWTHALMARFEAADQLAAFLARPPVAALAEGGGGEEAPVTGALVTQWAVAPAAGAGGGAPPRRMQ